MAIDDKVHFEMVVRACDAEMQSILLSQALAQYRFPQLKLELKAAQDALAALGAPNGPPSN